MGAKRINAGLIDFLISALIQAFLMFAFVLFPLVQQRLASAQVLGRVFAITATSMIYMLIRDVLGSRSVGKRIMRVKIISRENQQPAKGWQRLVRNLTWYLGVVELIVYAAAGRRIGDLLAGTAVVLEEKPNP